MACADHQRLCNHYWYVHSLPSQILEFYSPGSLVSFFPSRLHFIMTLTNLLSLLSIGVGPK